MAAQGSLPVWLLDGKEEITKSKEWDDFLQDLYDAVQQQLRESHVQSFTDLSVTERNLFIEKATHAVSGGPSFSELFNRVSKSLDRQLNNEVSRQLLEDFPVNTKTDLVIDCAQDGIISLLKRWPNMRSKLTSCFNQPLSDLVRPVAWKAFLENAKVLKQYLQTLSTKPRAAISPLDREISKTVEQMMSREPVFEELKGSLGALYAMKSLLSYFHVMNFTSADRLPDAFFYLSIPFLLLELPNLSSRKEPGQGRIVAQLVEEYFTFISSLPRFVSEVTKEDPEDQVRTFARRVAGHLYRMSQDLSVAISDAFVPSNENIVATEAGSRAILDDAVRTLIKPVIRNMFVCHVSKEVLLYIWDQYIIGLDSPGFSEDYLPAVTAVFLILLKDKLKAAGLPGRMESCLKNDGVKLTVPQFQYEMNKHFYQDLFSRFKHDSHPVPPVLDPTQANSPPWINWFARSQIPSHMTSDERRHVRDEREAERLRLLAKKREDLERQRREEEERVLKQQEQLRKVDRNLLEDELEKERRRRQETEQSAAEEIERLRQEIEDLRRFNDRRPSSRNSLASSVSHYLIPPPPSVATFATRMTPPLEMNELEEQELNARTPIQNLTPRTPARTPQPFNQPEKQTTTAVLDFLTRVTQSFHRVAGGEGYQKLDLDNQSKESIVVHRNDVRQAEIEVFGHELQPGQFEGLPRDVKEAKSQEILNIIRRQITDRRRQNLRNGMRR